MTTLNTEFVTKEQLEDLADLMANKYAFYLDGRKFDITAEHEGDIVSARVTLRNEDDSYFYPVEARLDLVKEEMAPYEAALFLVDYIDVYFEEYLEDNVEDVFLPIDWASHEYCGTNFQIRGQVQNLKVERMADELLARGQKYEGPDIII